MYRAYCDVDLCWRSHKSGVLSCVSEYAPRSPSPSSPDPSPSSPPSSLAARNLVSPRSKNIVLVAVEVPPKCWWPKTNNPIPIRASPTPPPVTSLCLNSPYLLHETDSFDVVLFPSCSYPVVVRTLAPENPNVLSPSLASRSPPLASQTPEVDNPLVDDTS